DVAQSVPVDESSRYFTLFPTGFLERSTAMIREKRTPLYNQLFLPARSIRVGQSWRGAVKIWGGAFSTSVVALPAGNTLEAVPWEHGVPPARLHSTHPAKPELH